MVPFDESSVLIPAATLEDFPADASDSDARSLLAGWTVLWDPRLVAKSEQLPTWYRADSPPEPDGPRIVVVPDSSFALLPSDYEGKCKNNRDCLWVTGADRQSMLDVLDLGDCPPALTAQNRSIDVNDFYAAAYCSLQIQIMTRRLRYTSNLDEIHLQKQLVAAAKAFLNGDADDAVSAMHNVFDCLSEERDHYFTSDPHLIDLNLLTPGTLEKWVASNEFKTFASQPDEKSTELPTPQNALVGNDVAEAIAHTENESIQSFATALRDGVLGWAGGAPDADVCFDAMTLSAAENALETARQLATDAIGTAPIVYGRFSGLTPADLTAALVRLGYEGVIPIDFSRGTGFGEEAKVIQQSGGVEIESLTAKPIDAAGDAAFLSLGARLGEAIDSGEIATGLFAHWPGGRSDSFGDLRRVASWCLALGKFWKLDEYFREGEHPYHHASTRSVSPNAAEMLQNLVASGAEDPVATLARTCQQNIAKETDQQLASMGSLALGEAPTQPVNDPASRLVSAVGAVPVGASEAKSGAAVIVNALGTGVRTMVSVSSAPAESEHIYGFSDESGQAVVSVDVPAYGFSSVIPATEAPKKSLLGRFFGKKKIADATALQNEFMEVAISPDNGSLMGVYSGAVRGNRFSMRLVLVTPDDDPKTGKEKSSMICDRCQVTQSSESVGEIQVQGRIVDENQKDVANYEVNYRLERGSRFLSVSGSIEPLTKLSDQPWANYLAMRVAVANESAVVRALIRDKVHRARSRRLVAPLGMLIDEADRLTLIASKGTPFHRRVGSRFIDTLVAVKGESKGTISVAYGFDVRNAVASAKAVISEPNSVFVEPGRLPPQGWIAHVAPSDLIITEMLIHERKDGRLAARVRLVQTRNKSASGVVRFCRDVSFATNVKSGSDDEINQEIPSQEQQDADVANIGGVSWKADTVRFPIAGHQISDILVVFADESAVKKD